MIEVLKRDFFNMIKRIMAYYKFRKRKEWLNQDHDITIMELQILLSQHNNKWLKWKYKPILMGRTKIDLYHPNIGKFISALKELYHTMGNGQYPSIENLVLESRAVDEWILINQVPFSWELFITELISAIDYISGSYANVPEKKKIYYHRISYYLREDIKQILKLMIKD